MVYFLIAIAMLADHGPVVMVREPHPATPWTQTVRAACGNTVVLLSGYGAGNPSGNRPGFLVAGRPVTGDAVAQMREDMSHRRAAYRFEILCGEPGSIFVRISEGEKQAQGLVRYRAAAAFIRQGRLETYTGLQEGDADSFWFR